MLTAHVLRVTLFTGNRIEKMKRETRYRRSAKRSAVFRRMEKMSHENAKREVLERTRNYLDGNHLFSRREFLLVSGVMVVAVSALEAWGAKETPLIIMDQAKGLVIADPTKCVGCRRCELACTEFNDGKASPTIARIKV